MAYPGRHNIYEATIRRMALESLEQQDLQFRQQHQADSDEQLLNYLRICAVRLRHTPWPGEILGGSFIEERFGSWQRAVNLARLAEPRTPNQNQSFLRYRTEVEKQKAVYRQRRAEKKVLAQKRLAQQAAKKKQSE